MENSKGSSSIRSTMYNGKNSALPPKSPHPSIFPFYTEYIPRSAIGPRALPKPRDGNSHHQHTSSESFLIDEQPSWLDELLNEPETPVRKGGHRRSSSDSFAYTDTTNVGIMNYITQDDNKFKNVTPLFSWASQDIDFYRDIRDSLFCPTNTNPSGKIKNNPCDTPLSLIPPPRGLPCPKDNAVGPNLGLVGTSLNADKTSSFSTERQDFESGPQGPKGSSNKKGSLHLKSSASETDTKHSKQQYAQRSRVRKLQYTAELERNVQSLQAGTSEVSSELEFLNQQNLILSLENKALKQRLESLSQEQLIKYFEHEVLEREAGRLRSLYQQQQQPPPQKQQFYYGHRCVKRRDLDQQFTTLSLKTKEASARQDSVSSQLHIHE